MLVPAVSSACKDITGAVYEQHRGLQILEAAVFQGEKSLTVPLSWSLRSLNSGVSLREKVEKGQVVSTS